MEKKKRLVSVLWCSVLPAVTYRPLHWRYCSCNLCFENKPCLTKTWRQSYNIIGESFLSGITKEDNSDIFSLSHVGTREAAEDGTHLTMFWNLIGTPWGSFQFWLQCVAQTEKEVSGQSEQTREAHQRSAMRSPRRNPYFNLLLNQYMQM